MLQGHRVLIAARSTARRTLRVGLSIGSQLPLHCSAAGRSLLWSHTDAQVRALLAGRAPERFTPRTLATGRELLRELAASRERGYSVCDEEIELGVRSIAVPVFDAADRPVAAMTISTRAERMTVAEMARAFLPALRRNQEWARGLGLR